MTTEQQLPEDIIPNSAEHVKWLMRERVEIIAPWFGMPKWYNKGTVIPNDGEPISVIHIPEGIVGWKTAFGELLKMPHLFNPLPWYAKRTESQMPEYLKYNNDNPPYNMVVWKIKRWNIEKGLAYCADGDGWADLNRQQKITPDNNFVPATQQEYLNQLNKTT